MTPSEVPVQHACAFCALASPAYTAKPGTNKFFILKHSVGYLPGNREIDVPLSYADYYYLEAMLRFKDRVLKK